MGFMTTDRLILRTINKDDRSFLLSVISDPRNAAVHFRNVRSSEEYGTMLEEMIVKNSNWTAIDKKTSIPVGCVSLEPSGDQSYLNYILQACPDFHF